jgi:hypothetical protein
MFWPSKVNTFSSCLATDFTSTEEALAAAVFDGADVSTLGAASVVGGAAWVASGFLRSQDIFFVSIDSSQNKKVQTRA